MERNNEEIVPDPALRTNSIRDSLECNVSFSSLDNIGSGHHVISTNELKNSRRRLSIMPGQRRNVVALLHKTREKHLAYANMHSMASRRYGTLHRILTLAILIITLIATILNSAFEQFAERIWHIFVNNITFASIAGLTAINNFLGYQKKEEQHKTLKYEHLSIVNLIEIALVSEEEDPTGHYHGILMEIQELYEKLKKTSVEIPEWIAKKYPQYEAPWLAEET